MTKKLLFIFLALLAVIPASAQNFDFSKENEDGVPIYYTWFNSTLCVTYKNKYYNSYSGDVVIPDSVFYTRLYYKVKIIDDNAFQNCVDLTSVTLPKFVQRIDKQAFYQCPKLKTIHFPASLQSVGKSAFYGCTNLKEVTIEDGLNQISEGAFEDCVSLSYINLPNTINKIEDNAFKGCVSLTSLRLPSSLLAVYDLFDGCTALKSVTIPENVNFISKAFKNCPSLKSLTVLSQLPSAITVQSEAFEGISLPNCTLIVPEGCKPLYEALSPWNQFGAICELAYDFAVENVDGALIYYRKNPDGKSVSVTSEHSLGGSYSGNLNIPSMVSYEGTNYWVTAINSFAFYDCPNLKSVTIPTSVTSIGEGVFRGCTGLEGIYGKFASADNRCLVDNGALNSFAPAGLSSYSIPKEITSIGNYAFDNYSTLTYVTIPTSVTSIGDCAFSGCKVLSTITIPASVKSIGTNAFKDCLGLYAVTVRNGLPSSIALGENIFENVPLNNCTLFIPNGRLSLFLKAPQWNDFGVIVQNCFDFGALNEDGMSIFYTIANDGTSVSVAYINASVNCYSGDVKIPESVTRDGTTYTVKYIGNDSFRNSTDLTSVTIPNTIVAIGTQSFQGCSSLKSVEIPNSVKSIGRSAFSNCSGLEEVTLSNTLTAIPEGAFYQCGALKSLYIPASVTSIGNRALFDCTSLTAVTGASGVTSIGESAFYNCPSMKEISLPNALESLGNYAFYDCKSLKEVNLDNALTAIGDNSFYGCMSLTSVALPQSLTSIGENAFSYCSGITSMDIPPMVNSIGSHAFANCARLNSVTLHNYMPSNITLGDGVFLNDPISSGVLFVPNGSKTEYAGAPQWNEFGKIVESNGAFYDFTLPNADGVAIYYNINSGGTSVSVTFATDTYNSYSGDVAIPASVIYNGTEYAVTAIAEKAFFGSSALTSVTIPEPVASIGVEAFKDCESLKSAFIPASVTEIASHAFANCYHLRKVNVNNGNPANINIDSYAFFNVMLNYSTLYVPKGAVTLYESAPVWSKFGKKAEFTYDFAAQNSDGKTIYYTFNPDGTGVSVSNRDESGESYSGYIAIPASVSYNGTEYGVTAIGESAFDGCTELLGVTIPETVTAIGGYAFYACANLTEFVIPASVTSIGAFAFTSCTGLQWINLQIDSPANIELDVEPFAEVNVAEVTLYVPKESLALYQQADQWKEFHIVAFGVGPAPNILIIEQGNQLTVNRGTEDRKFSVDALFGPVNIDDSTLKWSASGSISLADENAFFTQGALNEDATALVCSQQFVATAPGQGTITVTTGDGVLTATIDVTVVQYPGEIIFDEVGEQMTVEVPTEESGTFDLVATLLPNNVSWKEIVWSSSNPAVAKVEKSTDQSGLEPWQERGTVTYYKPVSGSETVVITASTKSIVTYNEGATYVEDEIAAKLNLRIARPYLVGDANGDGKINVSDIAIIIDYMLERNPSNFDRDAADVNEDGKINVIDISGIIQILLSK